MKTDIELVLTVATGLCGAGVMACTVKRWAAAGAFVGGLGLFLCSIWLMMRTL